METERSGSLLSIVNCSDSAVLPLHFRCFYLQCTSFCTSLYIELEEVLWKCNICKPVLYTVNILAVLQQQTKNRKSGWLQYSVYPGSRSTGSFSDTIYIGALLFATYTVGQPSLNFSRSGDERSDILLGKEEMMPKNSIKSF